MCQLKAAIDGVVERRKVLLKKMDQISKNEDIIKELFEIMEKPSQKYKVPIDITVDLRRTPQEIQQCENGDR